MMTHSLSNIWIVLDHPRVIGNIGWSARGMKNMGLSNLALVNPVEYQLGEIKQFAYAAEDVMEAARVFESLEEALRDMQFVIGTTRRVGRNRRPTAYMRDVAPEIVSAAVKNKVAVVFGSEDSGLTNADLSFCDRVVTIPEETDYPSLNLSHAVTLVCYELFLAGQSETFPPLLGLASREEVQGMYDHVRRVLAAIGYDRCGERDLLENILGSLKRLLGRTGLEKHDVNAIRGLCRRIELIAESLAEHVDEDASAP